MATIRHIGGKEVELHTRYKIRVEGTNEVNWQGIDQLRRYCNMESIPWDTAFNYLGNNGEAWSWKWDDNGTNPTYKGKLTTRLSKLFKVTANCKLTPVQLERIGTICRDNMNDKTQDYIFDFDDQLAWQDGQFGDKDSCFWGSHTCARAMLRDHSGLAIRFYDPTSSECTGKGIGRAWLVTDKPKPNEIILFNGYGLRQSERSTSTFLMAKILAAFLGESVQYHRIDLDNRYYGNNHVIYFNGHSYLLTTRESIGKDEYIDLKWQDQTFKCHACGEDTATSSDESYVEGPDHYHYCQDCMRERWPQCDHCNNRSDLEPVDVDGQTMYLCAYCRENCVSECPVCGLTVFTDRMHYMDNYGTLEQPQTGDICTRCYHERVATCHRCNRTRTKITMTLRDGQYICRECASLVLCTHCGHWHNPSRLQPSQRDSSNLICRDCAYVENRQIEQEAQLARLAELRRQRLEQAGNQPLPLLFETEDNGLVFHILIDTEAIQTNNR